jgi:hypothetical protein
LSPTVLSAQNAPPGSNPKAQAAASTPAAADDADDLAKATQNPVASLISVPIQNNSNFAVGPCNRTLDVLNIQPVIRRRLPFVVIRREIKVVILSVAKDPCLCLCFVVVVAVSFAVLVAIAFLVVIP